MLFTLKLTSNKDFLRLYKKGKYIVSKACIFYFMQNNMPYNRIGITTSKKVGNAVARNRARRIIRAAYTECETAVPIGYDIVIVARGNASNTKSTQISSFIMKRFIPELLKTKKDKNSQKSKKD